MPNEGMISRMTPKEKLEAIDAIEQIDCQEIAQGALDMLEDHCLESCCQIGVQFCEKCDIENMKRFIMSKRLLLRCEEWLSDVMQYLSDLKEG